MIIQEGFTTELDKNCYIETTIMNNEFDKLMTLLEMTELKRKQNNSDAECTVVTEGGSVDDLLCLYEANNNEANKAKQGIFKRIIEWFKKIAKTIKDGITKVFNKITGKDVDVKVDKGTIDAIGIIKKWWNKIKSGLSKIGSGDWKGALDILKALALPATLAIVTTGTIITIKRPKVQKDVYELSTMVDSTNDVIDKGLSKDNIPDIVKTSISAAVTILKKFVTFVKQLIFKLLGVLNKKGSATDEIDFDNLGPEIQYFNDGQNAAYDKSKQKRLKDSNTIYQGSTKDSTKALPNDLDIKNLKLKYKDLDDSDPGMKKTMISDLKAIKGLLKKYEDNPKYVDKLQKDLIAIGQKAKKLGINFKNVTFAEYASLFGTDLSLLDYTEENSLYEESSLHEDTYDYDDDIDSYLNDILGI